MSSKNKVSVYRRIDVRLTIWYLLTFLSIIIALFGFLDYRLGRKLIREIDRILVDEAHEIITVILDEPDNVLHQLAELEQGLANRKYYDMSFRVLDAKGRSLYTTAPLPGFRFPNDIVLQGDGAETRNMRAHGRGSPFRLCTYYYRGGSAAAYIVQVATYLRDMDKTRENFRHNLIAAFFVSLLFGSLGGWMLSRQTLQPIGRITETTRRITAANLQERLPVQGTDDELDQLAATINQMLDRLDTSFCKLSQFTADAAHELRTPVAALKGGTEVLLSQQRSEEEYQEALATNLEQLEFLTRLINNLLMLSQADEGKSSLQPEMISLDDLLKDLGDAFFPVAEQKNISLTVDRCETLRVQGDKIRLKQLFSNLIDNALKYTPSMGEITLALMEENHSAKVVLHDTGIGIPPEDLPFIFDRFYRVDKSRSRESGGTGLGLSICQWIVQAHQGTIRVESQPDKGTTITVMLPLIPIGTVLYQQ